MTPASNRQTAIIRTERGLTIAGTRLTLYDVMDFLKAQLFLPISPFLPHP